jgi:hypothetical protein
MQSNLKKVIICSLICVSALKGMGPGHYGAGFSDLPREIQAMIIQYVHNYNNPKELIAAIKNTSMVNKKLNQIVQEMYGNIGDIKGFNTIINVLAKRFPDEDRFELVNMFDTPMSRHYDKLGREFIDIINHLTKYSSEVNVDQELAKAQALINAGVDPNYAWKTMKKVSPLKAAYAETLRNAGVYVKDSSKPIKFSLLEEMYSLAKRNQKYVPFVQLLLENGAKPSLSYIDMASETELAASPHYTKDYPAQKALFNLLQEYNK